MLVISICTAISKPIMRVLYLVVLLGHTFVKVKEHGIRSLFGMIHMSLIQPHCLMGFPSYASGSTIKLYFHPFEWRQS